jgi:hypothetical protein
MAKNNLKILLEEASVKLSCAVNDMEDLTISKNHKINILDVLEELKVVKKLIVEAQFSSEQNRLVEY